MVVASMAMMMALAGCGELSKVNKAIESKDVATVAQYYGSLKEEDKAEVTDKVRLYCQELSVSYTDEQVDYETVKANFDILASEVMNGNEAFANMQESVEILHTSREAFKSAEELFAAKDFEKALAEYEKVIVTDKNYDAAQEKLNECKVAILPELEGKWTNTVDIGYVLASMMGMASDDRFHFAIEQVYEFNSDGTGKRYADEEKLKATMDDFINLLTTVIYEQYEEKMGVSRSQLDKLFKQQYGMSMEKYIKKESKLEQNFSVAGFTDEDLTYTVDGTEVKAMIGENEFLFTREKDELLLNQLADEETSSFLEDYKIELPLHFTKVN